MSSDKKHLTRRALIQRAAVVGAGAAAAGVVAFSRPGSALAAADVEKWDIETDVVVAGAGHGGLCAGIAAAEDGAKVHVLEISARTGGGSAWSGGYIHVAGLQNWDEYLAYTEGLHDPVLGKLFVETFRQTFIPWLTKIGAYFGPAPAGPGTGLWNKDYPMGKGEANYIRHRKYFDSLEAALKGKGGTLMTRTRAVKLFTDENRQVVGLRAMDVDKKNFINIKAKAVILATGNFVNNKELMQRYVGPWADMARPMSVPYATGEGLLMAQEVGAMLTSSMNTFSGSLAAVTPTPTLVADPVAYEKAWAENAPDKMAPFMSKGRLGPPGWIANANMDPKGVRAMLVNLDGKRFIDEFSPIASKYVRQPQAVISQRGGYVFMIGDKVIYDEYPASKTSIDAIVAEGGKVVIANTLEEFATKLEALGVYKGTLLKTLNEYNAAIDAKKAAELDPPRTGGFYKISTPPFYAIPTTVQVYFNMGGIAINSDAAALGMQKDPIPGLFAVPPVAGGIMREIYTGGIGIAGTFGYIAGKSAAKAAKVGV